MKNQRDRITNHKIYWYRCIPFVIAKVTNPEWELLKPLIKEKKLTMIAEMYNDDGSWYILEGIDYFYFKKFIYSSSNKEFLFSDTMKLRYTGSIFSDNKADKISDKEKKKCLINDAKGEIDNFWENIFKITIKK